MVTWRSLPRPSLLPPLPLAVAIIVLGAVAGLRELQLIEHFVGGGAGLDFFYDIAAARIGLAHGWAAVYDRQLYGQVSHFGRPVSFGNLPVIAWLAAPLVGVSFRTALLIWMTPLVALLLAAWWVASPTDRWERVLSLLALLSAPSVVAALDQGQFAIAVVGLLALHWWLVRVERPVLAGLALGLACIKPQTVFLVPCALALTGRWRSVVAWTATVAALLGVMGAVLGPGGVMAYGP